MLHPDIRKHFQWVSNSDGGSTQHDCNMEGKGRVTITSPWPYQPGFFRVYVSKYANLAALIFARVASGSLRPL
jgi:hypothetical protein